MSGLSSKEISYILKKGKKIYSKFFIIYFSPSNELKISPIVSKKISKKAVVRNKIKRRIRNLFRDKRKQGCFAVIAKSDISEINYKELVDDVEKVINKID